jgi:hypothetical protein
VTQDALEHRGAVDVGERLEIADLAFAEHEHSSAPEVRVEAREGQARLLGVRDGDAALEAVRAGEQFQVEHA